MDCRLCDYYSGLGGGSKAGRCEFADVIFFDDVDKLDAEYPCSSISYDEYLGRAVQARSTAKFSSDDWRYVYRREHLSAASGKPRSFAALDPCRAAAPRENVAERYLTDDWRLVYRKAHLGGSFVSTLRRAS
jgi:hypothetical protein